MCAFLPLIYKIFVCVFIIKYILVHQRSKLNHNSFWTPHFVMELGEFQFIFYIKHWDWITECSLLHAKGAMIFITLYLYLIVGKYRCIENVQQPGIFAHNLSFHIGYFYRIVNVTLFQSKGILSPPAVFSFIEARNSEGELG